MREVQKRERVRDSGRMNTHGSIPYLQGRAGNHISYLSEKIIFEIVNTVLKNFKNSTTTLKMGRGYGQRQYATTFNGSKTEYPREIKKGLLFQ